MDMEAEVDRIARRATAEMVGAAADWFRAHGIAYPADAANLDKLSAAIRNQVRPALDEGLRDAHEAVNAGLKELALATLTASLRNGGIRAAKKYAGVA